MKKTAIAAALLCAAFSSIAPAHADEPCNMTLCMFGVISGERSSECSGQIKKFFKKQVTSKGSFLPNHTADARKRMLNSECPSAYAASQQITEIISKFGRVKKL